MSGRRTPRYPTLRAYLIARRAPLPLPAAVGSPRAQALALAAASGLGGTGILLEGGHALAGGLLVAVAAVAAAVGLRRKRPAPPTAEQELAREADAVVRRLDEQFQFDPTHRFKRLHRTLHPAVAATLEECAGYHERVVAALGRGDWSHRAAMREGALTAAKVAMDEALVLAGKTLGYAPETRPLDAVSDALEDVGFGPLVPRRPVDPVPPAFYPARSLAEGLRELAVRCETAARQRLEDAPAPPTTAFRHLDAALGEMRRVEEAEGELRQGA